MTSQLPTEIAVLVAVIAFIGVVINAFVVSRNAEKQRELERELYAYKSSSAAALEVLKTRLEAELRYEKILIALNEENWKRVHSNILMLKEIGFETLRSFKELAGSGHDLSDQEVIEKSEAATALRSRFRKAVDALRAEIRPEDHARLEELLEFLMKVFLDVGRRRTERVEKREHMSALKEEILLREKKFEVLVGIFLQPYLTREQQHAQDADPAHPARLPLRGRPLGRRDDSLQDA